jgi:uncharacterized BrkB/YihY/UPF0761 family membrane protein
MIPQNAKDIAMLFLGAAVAAMGWHLGTWLGHLVFRF